MVRRSRDQAAEGAFLATLPDWVAALQNPDRWVTERTASVLSALGPLAQTAAPALAALMEDSGLPVERRERYARALAGVDPSGTHSVGAFIAWLRDPNPFLRDAAIHRLQAIGPRATIAVPGLHRVARADPVPALRACARSALLSIDPASARDDGPNVPTSPKLDDVAAFHKLYSWESLPTEGSVRRSRIVR